MRHRLTLSIFTAILLLTLPTTANTKRFIIERQVARTGKIILKNGALNSIVEIDSCLSMPGQDLYKPQDEKELAPENLPSFPGGDYGFSEYLSSETEYPYQARVNNISGRVLVRFTIEKDGSINEVKIMEGIGYGCDREAVRVLKASPKWNPGLLDGKPVRV